MDEWRKQEEEAGEKLRQRGTVGDRPTLLIYCVLRDVIYNLPLIT